MSPSTIVMTGGLDTEDLVTEVSNFALTSHLNNSHPFPSQLTTTKSFFCELSKRRSGLRHWRCSCLQEPLFTFHWKVVVNQENHCLKLQNFTTRMLTTRKKIKFSICELSPTHQMGPRLRELHRRGDYDANCDWRRERAPSCEH